MTAFARPLDELATKFRTDKSSDGHSYTQYYEMFFNRLRDSKINLLEIGIDSGASALMWRWFFNHAESEIHGVDIRDGYGYLHEKNIKTHVVDQSSEADLTMFGLQHENYFDIIIADGSHMAEDDILTFETLFLYLKPGGIFVIEDEICSYDKSRWGANANIFDRIKQMIDEVNMGGKMSNLHISSNKKREAPKYDNLTYFERYVEWVFQAPGITFIKKMDYAG